MKASISRKASIGARAATLFRKKGYQATSMRDIAEAENIKAASIYNHFKSKQEILSSLLLYIAGLFTQGMTQIKSSELNPVGQLEELIRLHVRLTVEQPDAIALITSEWIHLEAPNMQVYRQLRDDYEQEFKAVLEEGKAKGLFRKVDTDIALFSILSSLRWLYSWYGKNRSYHPDQLSRQMIETLLGGIKG